MENLNDLIKAMRCLASQHADGSCYEGFYNATKEGPRMSCHGSLDGTIRCPYCQDRYEVCFEDGDCSEWLEYAAELLEKINVSEKESL